MNKQLAQKITSSLTVEFLNALTEYADEQIKRTTSTLYNSTDLVSIHRAQGYITAMTNLKQIRDDAVAVMKQENHVGREISNPKTGTWG